MSVLRSKKNQLKTFYGNEVSVINSSIYKKAYLEIMRDYPLAIIKLRTREEEAKPYAINIMRKAMRFEVGEAVLHLSLKLARFHLFEGNINQVEKYQKITNKYKEIVEEEIRVESYLIEINKDIVKKINSNLLLKKLEAYINELEIISEKINSYSFTLFFHELKFKKYQLQENKEMILQTCQQSLNALNKKKFQPPEAVLLMFTYPKIPIFIEKGNIDYAKQAIQTCYANSRKNTNNWYVAHSYDVILGFYEGRFDDVEKLLSRVKNYPTDLVRERYKLYKAYSALMGTKRFRVGKFINDLPQFSKDKQGYNIAAIIIQLLHLLKNKSYDKFIDRVDATNQYIKRAVNAKQVLRSKYFLKIVLLLPASNFHPVLFQAKTKNYRKKLENLPICHASPSVEIELIPYEMLYNRIIFLLENK